MGGAGRDGYDNKSFEHLIEKMTPFIKLSNTRQVFHRWNITTSP